MQQKAFRGKLWRAFGMEQYSRKCERVTRKNFPKSGEISVWASIKVKECWEKVEPEDRGVSVENHCASRWRVRCHFVVRGSSLSLLTA